jgi:hypothetical protein
MLFRKVGRHLRSIVLPINTLRIGTPSIMVDSTILDKIHDGNKSNIVGLEGIFSGWSIESLTTWSVSKLNFAGLLAGFGYNGIKGSFDQYQENAEHDKGTQPQLPESE